MWNIWELEIQSPETMRSLSDWLCKSEYLSIRNIWEIFVKYLRIRNSKSWDNEKSEWLIVQKWMDETAEVTTSADQLSELSDEDNDGSTILYVTNNLVLEQIRIMDETAEVTSAELSDEDNDGSTIF